MSGVFDQHSRLSQQLVSICCIRKLTKRRRVVTQIYLYIALVTPLKISCYYYYYYYYYYCRLSQVFFFPVLLFTQRWSPLPRLQILDCGALHISVMSQVQLSFIVNLLNVFLVWRPNFSLKLSLLFRWLQFLPVQPYSSYCTLALSLYINFCIRYYYYYYYYLLHFRIGLILPVFCIFELVCQEMSAQ